MSLSGSTHVFMPRPYIAEGRTNPKNGLRVPRNRQTHGVRCQFLQAVRIVNWAAISDGSLDVVRRKVRRAFGKDSDRRYVYDLVHSRPRAANSTFNARYKIMSRSLSRR